MGSPIINYQPLLDSVTATAKNPINTNANPSTSQCIGLNCDQITGLPTLYYNIALTLLYVVSTVAVLTFIYAGISYITAGGDAEKVEKAKRMIIGSIIGILIITASFLVFRTTVNVVNAPVSTSASTILNQP